MAEVTAKAVMQLRELTTLPMMDCKKALVEAGGDQNRAIAILKEQFKKITISRAENATKEGLIAIALRGGGAEAAMVEVQCESAPVASSAEFISFANQCVNQLLNGPGAATPAELLAQPSATQGKTLQGVWEDLTNQIREKFVVAKVARILGPVNGYIHHDGKNGVLFQVEGEGKNFALLRDVAMHIAALKPTVTFPEELDQASVNAERNRLTVEARATGKPENIIDKIVDGRMNNFYMEQGVLLNQAFAKDDSKTVSQVLAEAGYKAKSFVRWVLGN